MSAVPLSSYGKPYTAPSGTVDPSIDKKVAVRDQLNAMDGASYFKHFAELLKTRPAHGRRRSDGLRTREDWNRAGAGF